MTGARPTQSGADAAGSGDDLLAPLIKGRGRLILGILAGAGLGILLWAVLPRRYDAVASFAPESQSSNSLGSLAGLAGLAGQLSLGSVSLGASAPDYYASVLGSRELLAATLRTPFADSALGIPAPGLPLLQILDVEPQNGSDTLSAGLRLFAKRMRVNIDRRPGIVSVGVQLSSPALSAAVANRMVALLNEFNLERRQSQSRAQARFTKQRLDQAAAELRAAEQEQSAFLQRNRVFRGAPMLELQAARLNQTVQLKQEVHASLSKNYEEARIAQVRDTPVLTVIDSAAAPDEAASPRAPLLVATGTIAGLLLALLSLYAASIERLLRGI